MGNIFLTSDLHFGHNKEFIYKVRGFNSIEEMNEIIIEKWNSVVSNDDDVYILGDLMLGELDNIKYIERLNGRLHIVLGNHDTPNRENAYRQLANVVEVELAISLKYRKYHFFLTHYPCLTGNLERESLHQMTLNLYGHTHQMNNFFYEMPYEYHVGMDSHNCYPILLDDIIQEMKNKVKECLSYLDN